MYVACVCCVCACACACVCVCASETIKVIITELGTVTALDMGMHHVLIISTFIQGYTDLKPENNKCLIISETKERERTPLLTEGCSATYSSIPLPKPVGF